MFFLLTPLRRTPPPCPAERTQTGTFRFSAYPGKVRWCLEWASFQIPHFSTVLPARALLFYYVGESPGHDTRAHGQQPHASGLKEQSQDDGGNIVFFFPSIILTRLDISHVFLLWLQPSCIKSPRCLCLLQSATSLLPSYSRQASHLKHLCTEAAASVTQRLRWATIVSGSHGAHVSHLWRNIFKHSNRWVLLLLFLLFSFKTVLSSPSSTLSCPPRLCPQHTHTHTELQPQALGLAWPHPW